LLADTVLYRPGMPKGRIFLLPGFECITGVPAYCSIYPRMARRGVGIDTSIPSHAKLRGLPSSFHPCSSRGWFPSYNGGSTVPGGVSAMVPSSQLVGVSIGRCHTKKKGDHPAGMLIGISFCWLSCLIYTLCFLSMSSRFQYGQLWQQHTWLDFRADVFTALQERPKR